MCKTDDKVKFFHNWQAWQKVMPRAADNLALSAADHPPNFAPDILMLSQGSLLISWRYSDSLARGGQKKWDTRIHSPIPSASN